MMLFLGHMDNTMSAYFQEQSPFALLDFSAYQPVSLLPVTRALPIFL